MLATYTDCLQTVQCADCSLNLGYLTTMAIKLSKKFVCLLVFLFAAILAIVITCIVSRSTSSGVVAVLDHTATIFNSRSLNESEIFNKAPSIKPVDAYGNNCTEAKASYSQNGNTQVGPFTDLCQVMKGRGDGCYYKHPNVVHYVKLTKDSSSNIELTFQEYISILSVHKFYHPDKIIIHSNVRLIGGEYWEKASTLGTEIELEYTERIKTFGRRKQVPFWITHEADIIKVQTMLTRGGVFMDFDAVIVNGTRLREQQAISECVIGTDTDPCSRLCAGFVSCVPHSPFVYMWWEGYEQNYLPYLWVYNAGTVPSNILRKCTNCYDVYVDNTFSNMEIASSNVWLKPNGVDWRAKPVAHYMNGMFNVHSKDITPQFVNHKLTNTSLGEMFQYILEDSQTTTLFDLQDLL